MRTRLTAIASAAATTLAASSFASAVDPFDPGTYYDNIDPAAGNLIGQLETRLAQGHSQTTYGEVRFALPVTDQDPNDSSNMLLVYTRDSNDGQWQSGDYQTREHVWPVSRLGTSGSNSTRGRYGDIHMLKPAEAGINSDRANFSFGFGGRTGAARVNSGPDGGYFFPGDADKGDVARIAFYAATRWRANGLKLVDGIGDPNDEEMGDLTSLLLWHYLDTPDDFERRRNQVIFDDYTNNRNAYIDRPEYAWAVFRGNDNDTRLDVTTNDTTDFGKVLVGASVDATVDLTVEKTGADGTYYEVRVDGDVTSDAAGRYNALTLGTSPTARLATISASLPSGFNNTIGQYGGTVTVDNLDVTTGGGFDRGANDADDVVSLSATVVAQSNASFSNSADVEAFTLDLGIIGQGLGDFTDSVDVFNFAGGIDPALLAGLDVDGTDAGLFGGTDFAAFLANASASDLAAGASTGVEVTLNDDAIGDFSAGFLIGTSDADNVLGGRGFLAGDSLELSVLGEVRLPGDADGDGAVALSDFGILRANFGTSPDGFVFGDFNRDGNVDLSDFGILRSNFGGTASDLQLLDAWVSTIPEPAAAGVVLIGCSLVLRRRRA
ncbi:MAG: endonuclease [Planctomycetota bacterium]